MERGAIEYLESLAKLVRYYILLATSKAGSGHPTSSLSATDLITTLMFGGFFLYDPARPSLPNNDRFILSKGHASPLLYALWTVAGQVSEEELLRYRTFGSPLEGHPTPHFKYADVATGSLGQGLSIGVGMALNSKYLDKLPHRTYVLLGDSEMAEGSNWEAMEIAAHYKLDNLVGIIDVNRLGQRGETMYGWDVEVYERRAAAFGWQTIVIDGHDYAPDIRRIQAGPRRERKARNDNSPHDQRQGRARSREQERLARKSAQKGRYRRGHKKLRAARQVAPGADSAAPGPGAPNARAPRLRSRNIRPERPSPRGRRTGTR